MKQAEVEVKVEQRSAFPHLSLSLNLPLTLADFFNRLLDILAERSDRLEASTARRSGRRAAVWVWEGNYLELIRCELARSRRLLSFAFRLLRGLLGMRQRFLRMLHSFLGMLERFLSVGFRVSF